MDQKNFQSSSMDHSSSFSNKDHYLKQLNKLSHNISKPNNNHTFNKQQHTLPESHPHVYNISKNDFRDMVQKLTGSPGHNPQPLKPVVATTTTRLHRLRPPPLPQVVSHRPPPHSDNIAASACAAAVPPPSPLPPFPSVHAESPVSVYMRFLRNSMPRSESEFQLPASPVSFGCSNSVACSQVPLSPTVPVSSPGWRNL